MTAQVGEVPAAVADSWLRQCIAAELAAMLSRRLAELDFLGAERAPFEDVLGRLGCGPGKRLRPTVVYWGYRAAGGAATGPEAAAAIRVACAVEFLHACALICDDLMDGGTARRWEPAAHVQLARAALRVAALRVAALRVAALRVAALRVAALRVAALRVAALRVAALRVAALRAWRPCAWRPRAWRPRAWRPRAWRPCAWRPRLA